MVDQRPAYRALLCMDSLLDLRDNSFTDDEGGANNLSVCATPEINNDDPFTVITLPLDRRVIGIRQIEATIRNKRFCVGSVLISQVFVMRFGFYTLAMALIDVARFCPCVVKVEVAGVVSDVWRVVTAIGVSLLGFRRHVTTLVFSHCTFDAKSMWALVCFFLMPSELCTLQFDSCRFIPGAILQLKNLQSRTGRDKLWVTLGNKCYMDDNEILAVTTHITQEVNVSVAVAEEIHV